MPLYVGGDSVCDYRFLENSKFGAVCHLYGIYGIVDTHPERAINLSVIHRAHLCGIKQYREIELHILGYITRCIASGLYSKKVSIYVSF